MYIPTDDLITPRQMLSREFNTTRCDIVGVYDCQVNEHEPSEDVIIRILKQSWRQSIADICIKANCTANDVRWVHDREQELRQKYKLLKRNRKKNK